MASTIKVNNFQSQCGSCGTITIGGSGDTVSLGAGASQSGFGRTGTVDWDTTAKTAAFTAVSGNGYFVNTSSGSITVSLPAGSAGDIISLADYTNTWQTNAVTVSPNGTDKIGGINAPQNLTVEGQSVTFVFVDSTEGWKNVQDSTSNITGNPFLLATGGTITTCGNFKIHTFTSPGTFAVQNLAQCSANNKVEYLVVAGGGGGGSSDDTSGTGGGGGAGGFRESCGASGGCYTTSPLAAPCAAITVTATDFPITVGAGGAGGNGSGETGSNSIFSTITSAGGGGGSRSQNTFLPQSNGGSGGGKYRGDPTVPAGQGNTPPVSPPQGNPGGSGGTEHYAGGGGGGGAGAPGGAQNNPGGDNPSPGPPGGAGVSTSISGSSVGYAGGGDAGSSHGFAQPNGNGVPFGGAKGGFSSPPATISPVGPGISGCAAVANKGGGGGSGSSGGVADDAIIPGTGGYGGAGGSGIVIIRYKYQ